MKCYQSISTKSIYTYSNHCFFPAANALTCMFCLAILSLWLARLRSACCCWVTSFCCSKALTAVARESLRVLICRTTKKPLQTSLCINVQSSLTSVNWQNSQFLCQLTKQSISLSVDKIVNLFTSWQNSQSYYQLTRQSISLLVDKTNFVSW